MPFVDTAGEQIEGQPATIIVECCLVGDLGSAVRFAQVLGLYEQGSRIDFAYRLHRRPDRQALVQNGPHEGVIVTRVRIPMTVKRGEPGRREWLVDRCVHVDPRIPPSDRAGKLAKFSAKGWIEKTCVSWTAAVVDQPDDRSYSQLSHFVESQIAGCPVCAGWRLGRDTLPQKRISQGTNTEIGEALQVREDSMFVPGEGDLIEVPIPDTINRALDSPPDLKRFWW